MHFTSMWEGISRSSYARRCQGGPYNGLEWTASQAERVLSKSLWVRSVFARGYGVKARGFKSCVADGEAARDCVDQRMGNADLCALQDLDVLQQFSMVREKARNHGDGHILQPNVKNPAMPELANPHKMANKHFDPPVQLIL